MGDPHPQPLPHQEGGAFGQLLPFPTCGEGPGMGEMYMRFRHHGKHPIHGEAFE